MFLTRKLGTTENTPPRRLSDGEYGMAIPQTPLLDTISPQLKSTTTLKDPLYETCVLPWKHYSLDIIIKCDRCDWSVEEILLSWEDCRSNKLRNPSRYDLLFRTLTYLLSQYRLASLIPLDPTYLIVDPPKQDTMLEGKGPFMHQSACLFLEKQIHGPLGWNRQVGPIKGP